MFRRGVLWTRLTTTTMLLQQRNVDSLMYAAYDESVCSVFTTNTAVPYRLKILSNGILNASALFPFEFNVTWVAWMFIVEIRWS